MKHGEKLAAGVTKILDQYTAPKFGYRCAYFKDSSSYIKSTNNNYIFNIFKSNNYEIEAFVKLKSYQAGNIVFFDNTDRQVIWANYNGHTFAYFTNY